LGDKSTKFFHAAATERFKLNTITSIDTEEGKTVTTHSEKEVVLWDEYINQLGFTAQAQMHFKPPGSHKSMIYII
jgi:hypothetical protein